MPLDTPPTSRLETRLLREIKGRRAVRRFHPWALFDRTPRSIRSSRWGVVVAKDREDIAAAIQIAREEGVPVLPRGRRHLAVRPDGQSRARR